MAYQVEFQDKIGYFFAHVQGKRTVNSVVELIKDLSERAIELHHKRVLVDVRDFEGWLQIMESNYVVTSEFPKLRGKGLQKAAILDREPVEPNRWFFFETVAQNRGFDLRIFNNEKSALDWLLEGVDLEK
jgi:hypothetical protein